MSEDVTKVTDEEAIDEIVDEASSDEAASDEAASEEASSDDEHRGRRGRRAGSTLAAGAPRERG